MFLLTLLVIQEGRSMGPPGTKHLQALTEIKENGLSTCQIFNI